MSGYCPRAACRPRVFPSARGRENYKNGINSLRKSQRLCYNDRLEPDAATGMLRDSGSCGFFGGNTRDSVDAAAANVLYMLTAVDSAFAEYDAGFTMGNFGSAVDCKL